MNANNATVKDGRQWGRCPFLHYFLFQL